MPLKTFTLLLKKQKEIMKEILSLIKKKYSKILTEYYPTYGNRGFTEQNLSALFVEAYKEIYPDTIAWFEAPLESVKKENGHFDNKHIDVILFDFKEQTMILVESKRIHSERKLNGAKQDLRRITDRNNFEFLLKNLRNRDGIRRVKSIILVLADIWTDKRHKISRLEKWKKHDVFDIDGDYFYTDFTDFENAGDAVKQYCILAFVHETALAP